MSNPLVSILVPVYHVEEYIEKCARSLFEQTYDNLEYIFCDDCSPDASIQKLKEVMKEYPTRLEHMRILRHEQNRGIAATRNDLLSNSKGDFLFWVDSDDWIETNAIELLVARQQEIDADIVTGRAYAHMNGKTTRCHDGWDLDKHQLIEEIIKCNCGSTLWRRLFRKLLFIDNDIKFCVGIDGREDYAVTIPLLYYAKKIAGIDAIVYHYNMTNTSSLSYGYKDLSFQLDYLESCEQIIAFFEGKDEHYCCLCKEMKIKRAHDFMMIHYRHRCRKGYQTMVNYLAESDRRYWKRIRWDNGIIRIIESNYYMISLTYSLRRICAKYPF